MKMQLAHGKHAADTSSDALVGPLVQSLQQQARSVQRTLLKTSWLGRFADLMPADAMARMLLQTLRTRDTGE